MFTGLIEATGVIASITPSASGVRLVVRSPAWSHHPAVGDSISVSGCCLTVAAGPAGPGELLFDVVPETLAKTTLDGWRDGRRVNLEHAATASTLLGGHIVQGHVDGVGKVARLVQSPEWRIRIRPPGELMEFIAPKGSVAVDGVSLTVADLSPAEGWFEVALIPTTLDKTTLGALVAGDRCNLECDVLSKTIVHWLKHYGSKE
ncbi:MAG: riboflavin synthase [Phycisphaerales bacterium]|nr:riboflavin synthase [Phycisphaerales bacterium]